MKLTTENIELPEGKADAIFFDDALIGFGLRVRRGSGDRIIRNWIIQYRAHGRARRMIVGSAETLTAAKAREQARKLLAEVELGGDPQAAKSERREKDTLSLRAIVRDFLAQKSGVKPGTMRMLRTYLEGPLYLKPLHSVPVDRIKTKDVAARLLAVAKTSGTPTALGLRSAVSSLFTWALMMGLIEHNPVIGSFKPPQPESRDRVLTNAELAAIWQALADDDYGKIIKLLILTGCRRAEIGGMRWPEFDFAKSTWTLPKERSKNGLPHTLPITPLMREIVGSVLVRNGVDVLFGRNGFTAWGNGKDDLDEKLADFAPWTIHDIRRSVASGMGDIGIQPHIIEEILNHRSGHRRGVAGVYNRSPYEREVRDALLRWSDHVRAAVTGGERKVVAFEPLVCRGA
jgi:integrase